MNAVKSTYRATTLIVLALAFLALYYVFDPLESAWMPQCLFHKATGLQCMGCGSQRAVHALLHGDMARAWSENAMMIVALPFLAFLAWLELRRKQFPGLYSKVHAPWLMPVAASILIAWMILRNIFSV